MTEWETVDMVPMDTELRRERSDGDARLIAAAPDLLAACRIAAEIVRILADDPEVQSDALPGLSRIHNEICAAIAKATGGTS